LGGGGGWCSKEEKRKELFLKGTSNEWEGRIWRVSGHSRDVIGSFSERERETPISSYSEGGSMAAGKRIPSETRKGLICLLQDWAGRLHERGGGREKDRMLTPWGGGGTYWAGSRMRRSRAQRGTMSVERESADRRSPREKEMLGTLWGRYTSEVLGSGSGLVRRPAT